MLLYKLSVIRRNCEKRYTAVCGSNGQIMNTLSHMPFLVFKYKACVKCMHCEKHKEICISHPLQAKCIITPTPHGGQ